MFTRLVAAAFIAAIPFTAAAAPVDLTVNLTVTTDNGVGNSFIGQTGTATLRYDDADTILDPFAILVAQPVSLLPGVVPAPPGFDFTLDIFGQTFTDPNDTDSTLTFSLFPNDWSVSISESDFVSPTAINNPLIRGFSSIGPLNPGDFQQPNTFFVNVAVDDIVAPIPLPATAPLLGAGLIALGAFLRRRKKAA